MKHAIFVFLISVLFAACGTKKSETANFDTFYGTYEDAEGVMALKVAPFLLKLMATTESKEIDDALAKVQEAKVFVCNTDVNNLSEQLKEHLPNENYEILMTIDRETAKVTVYVRVVDDKVVEVVSLAVQEKSFGAMQIKGEFGRDEIKSLIKSVDIDEALKMQH